MASILRRPCLVMIGAAAGRTTVMLPQMHHRMGEGREHLFRAAVSAVRWVQGNLIGDYPGPVVPALAREIPIGAILALHGDETLWLLSAKKPRVEEIIGLLQCRVGLFSGGRHAAVPLE